MRLELKVVRYFLLGASFLMTGILSAAVEHSKPVEPISQETNLPQSQKHDNRKHRKRLHKFCNKHPKNEECKEFLRKKQEKQEFCKKNPEDVHCKRFEKLKQKRQERKEFCAKNPEDAKCQKHKNKRTNTEKTDATK